MKCSVVGATVTELRSGQTAKPFYVHKELLITRSPYFRDVFASQAPGAELNPLSFPDLDEFAFALFVRWLYGAMLNGPSDYHSMQHYISLYVLALHFRIERLCNEIMDMVRRYYRSANMTAPAYRLQYIYETTHTPNAMRRFLIGTAAYRALCEGTLSGSIRDQVSKGGELSMDFMKALIDCHKSGLLDCRRGMDCLWHEHQESKRCRKVDMEPWQNA